MLTAPLRCKIRVHGRLPRDWSDWFGELSMQELRPSELLLTGWLPDQSALLGVLMRLHNLNIAIVSVEVFRN